MGIIGLIIATLKQYRVTYFLLASCNVTCNLTCYEQSTAQIQDRNFTASHTEDPSERGDVYLC